MTNERTWILIARKLSGETNGPEEKELEKLLLINPELGYQIEMLCEWWNGKHIQHSNDADIKKIFERIREFPGRKSSDN